MRGAPNSGGLAFAETPIDEHGDQGRGHIGADAPDDALRFGRRRRCRQTGLATEPQPQGGRDLARLRLDLLIAVRNRLLERRRPQSRGPGPRDVAVIIVAEMLDLIGRQSEHTAHIRI